MSYTLLSKRNQGFGNPASKNRRSSLDAKYTENLPVADCGFGDGEAVNLQGELIFYDCGVSPSDSAADIVLVISPQDLDQAGMTINRDQTAIPVNNSSSLAPVANKRGALAITYTGNLQKSPIAKVLAEMDNSRTATKINDNTYELIHSDQGGATKQTYGALLTIFTVVNGARKVLNTRWAPRAEVMFSNTLTLGISQTNTVAPFTINLLPYNENNDRMVERWFE